MCLNCGTLSDPNPICTHCWYPPGEYGKPYWMDYDVWWEGKETKWVPRKKRKR